MLIHGLNDVCMSLGGKGNKNPVFFLSLADFSVVTTKLFLDLPRRFHDKEAADIMERR